ncbi:MAG: hypothetical protein AAF578_13040 [Pseudomonadota bacterium]
MTYTLVSYPRELWTPYFVLVLGAASFYCLFVVMPLLTVLTWKKWNSISTFIFLLAAVTFAIFFAWNVISYGSSIKYVQGGQVLVENGAITTHGYIASLRDSIITALIGSLGGLVLWISAIGTRKRTDGDGTA